MMWPSPIGPFWWAQRLVSAPICVPSRKTAMRSPSGGVTISRALVRDRNGGPTASQPSLPRALAAIAHPLAPAGYEMQQRHVAKAAASIAGMSAMRSYCMMPSATCITTSP